VQKGFPTPYKLATMYPLRTDRQTHTQIERQMNRRTNNRSKEPDL